MLLGHEFRVVQEGRKDFKVTTTGYRYHVLSEDDRELIAWHWHPGGDVGHPHIHVPAGLITRKAHVPTGRVSIESILRFLIDDLRVLLEEEPLPPDGVSRRLLPSVLFRCLATRSPARFWSATAARARHPFASGPVHTVHAQAPTACCWLTGLDLAVVMHLSPQRVSQLLHGRPLRPHAPRAQVDT